MKNLLLILLSVLVVTTSQAQNPLTVLNAFSAVRSGSVTARARQQDPQAYTKPVIYEGEMFHCKRTPGAAQLRKGGTQIVILEQLLADRYSALLADTVGILTPAWEAQYTEALKQVQHILPTWSTLAYEEEVTFYRREDEGRRQWLQEVRLARQKRARRVARRDSLARLTPPLPAATMTKE